MLNDEIDTVFVNTEGDRRKVSRELANIMDYIATGQAEDDYTKRLDEVVESLRNDDGKERLYMTYQQTIMEHEALALQKGIEQGIEKGRFNTLVELVREGMLDMRNAAQKSGIPLEAFKKLIDPRA